MMLYLKSIERRAKQLYCRRSLQDDLANFVDMRYEKSRHQFFVTEQMLPDELSHVPCPRCHVDRPELPYRRYCLLSEEFAMARISQKLLHRPAQAGPLVHNDSTETKLHTPNFSRI